MTELEKIFVKATEKVEQKPRELLIIKSNAFIHPEALKKWLYDIEKGKERGVIILPPYFDPILVPDDIEIKIEQPAGEWIPIPYEIDCEADAECSLCHKQFIAAMNYNYCPHCGAKMKSEGLWDEIYQHMGL